MTDHTARAADARKGSPFLSTREAAFCLGLSFRKHGRFVCYHIVDLDAWSEGRRHSSTSDEGERG